MDFDAHGIKTEIGWADDSEFGHWELYPSHNNSELLEASQRDKLKEEMIKKEFSSDDDDDHLQKDDDSNMILGFEMEDPGPSPWVNEDLLNSRSQQLHNGQQVDQIKREPDQDFDDNDGSMDSESAQERIKFLEENIKMEADQFERLQSSSSMSPSSFLLPGHYNGQSPFNPDHEKYLKKLLIQRHLILLLHAQKCQSQRDHGDQAVEDEDVMQCTLPLCRVAKNLMDHMRHCQHDKNCTDSHCFSSHLIVSHWNSCQNPDCLICSPLRKQLNFDLSKIPSPLNPYPYSNYPSSSSSSSSTLLSKSAVSSDHSYASSSLPSPASASSDDLIKPIEKVKKGNSIKKEWQSTVSEDIRKRLVYKIVSTICPEFVLQHHPPQQQRSTNNVNPVTMTRDVENIASLDQKMMKRLVAYATRLETKIFEAANSPTDYYDLLSDRLYWIQTERLDMRRRVRHECARRALKFEILDQDNNEEEEDEEGDESIHFFYD